MERQGIPPALVGVALVFAAIAVWRLMSMGHIQSPLAALVVVIIVAAGMLLVFRLRARR